MRILSGKQRQKKHSSGKQLHPQKENPLETRLAYFLITNVRVLLWKPGNPGAAWTRGCATVPVCQMYDNDRIYTIILTSVRCTINNGKNPIMYDNFRVFSRSSKHTSYRFSLSDPESFRRLSCLHASTYTHTYTRTHTHTHTHTTHTHRHHTVSPATRCLHVSTTTLQFCHYSFAPWRHAICTVKGFPNQQHLPTQHKWMWHLMMTAT